MFTSRIRAAGLAIVAALGVSACGYNQGYGYGGLGGGFGTAYYDDGFYGDPAFVGGFGAFGNPYWGWNNGFYYPGTGAFVYGRDRRPVRWNGAQQRYWEGRRSAWRGPQRDIRANWRDFRQERRVDNRAFRQDRRQDRRALRQGQVTRPEFRADRRADRQAFRQDRRQDARQLRRANRQAVNRGVRNPGNRYVPRGARRPR